MTRKKIIVLVVAVVVVAAAVVIGVVASGGGNSNSGGGVLILTKVQPRTLQTTVQLSGTLAHKKIRNVTAVTQGLVNAVYAKDGTVEQPGDTLFQLNGRDAIAEPGTEPFFRQLVPGDSGQDVIELKKILASAGDYPGTMGSLFTEQTRFALAQWQAQHHYPNATPAAPTSVTVALQQGSGYQVGDEDSAGLIIGPSSDGATDAAVTGGGAKGTLLDYQSDDRPLVTTPSVTIQSVSAQVSQGQPAAFVVTASSAPSANLSINLSAGGSAGANDIVSPPPTATILAGTTQTSVTVQTRFNNEIESSKTITLTVSNGSGYTVGSPNTAQTTIANNNVPSIQLSGTTTVAPGGTATLTLTANEAPLQNTQVFLSFAGDANPGSDYDVPNPVVTLKAGTTSATFTLTTLSSQAIAPNRYVVVSLSPSPASYSVASPDAAVVTISGSSSLPTVTLTSATQYLQKGQPYAVTINLSEALSTPLTISLGYSGTAVEGTDFTAPAGSIVVPPGQTALPVTIPTIVDNTVESNRVLTVTLTTNSGYQIGTPDSASVTIASESLPKLTISVSTSAVTEGGAATFTITANQAPVKNTSVNFVAAGTAQPGMDYEPISGTALLLAGQTQVSVTIQSIRKDVVFLPTDMIVGTWPTRIGTVNVKAGTALNPGVPILELTQPTESVTLGASAADTTDLSVGEKATVQVSGSTTKATGTITELDSTPTATGPSGGAQVYQGTVTLQDLASLHGTDGSTVSITVVDKEAVKAKSVPIDAVSQNGLGANVVRVITRSGIIHDVPVTTGLTEGSYIQITKGLHMETTVIVQQNQSQ